MAKAGSCKTGLRPFPSSGIGLILINGLEVKTVKPMKPILTKFEAKNTLDINLFSLFFVYKVRKKPYKPKKANHINNEPSWLPQVPDILYRRGLFVWELLYIFNMLKSDKV